MIMLNVSFISPCLRNLSLRFITSYLRSTRDVNCHVNQIPYLIRGPAGTFSAPHIGVALGAKTAALVYINA
jgi:hypothetical protein